MISKVTAKYAEFQDAEHKLDWLRQDWKWRLFPLRQRKQIPLNLAFDRRHNVETATEITLDKVGVSAADASLGNGIYRCITEEMFQKIAASLKIDATDYTFLDIGSGKGKVLFLAADLPFRRIIGIEYPEGLHEAAVRNIVSYRSDRQRCHDIQSVHANALQYPMPPGPLVVLVFNALAPELMAEFLQVVDLGPASEPDRPVLVVYANLRTVRELTGNPFYGLKHLQVIDRDSRVIVSGNQAGRLARDRSRNAAPSGR